MWKIIRGALMVLGAMALISLALFGLSKLGFVQNLSGGDLRPGLEEHLERQGMDRRGFESGFSEGMGRIEGTGRHGGGWFSLVGILPGLLGNLLKLTGIAAIVVLLWKGVEWLARRFKARQAVPAAEAAGLAGKPAAPAQPQNDSESSRLE